MPAISRLPKPSFDRITVLYGRMEKQETETDTESGN